MRRLLVVVLALGLASAAFAAQSPTSSKLNTDLKGVSQGDGGQWARTGGDNIGTATVITALPYNDTGATCGAVNDYDEVCPYTGSASPDLVYAYTPTSATAITVDLCASQYDTKVYIYAGGVGNLVACNDDAGCGYSGYQSKVENVALTAGVTYYIVVDGYGSACGSYVMAITAYQPCDVVCPAGSIPEGEPPCGDNYYDSYNGGCNSVGWTVVPADADGCTDICGLSGTYLYQGSSYRDTDWYDATGAGVNMTMDTVAEFPLQAIFIYGTDCNNLLYDITTAGACQHAILSRSVGNGVHVWLWVGAQVFTGIPCSAEYWMHVCGLAPTPIPAEKATWGSIKHLYK